MPPMAYVKKYCKMIDKWLKPEEGMEQLLNKIYVEVGNQGCKKVFQGGATDHISARILHGP